MEIDEDKLEFDWGSPGRRPFGLDERQYNLALGLLAGQTQAAAAEAAGYTISKRPDGQPNRNGRSNASKAARAKKVEAAIKAFKAWHGERPESDVDEAELVNLLSKAVRSPSSPGERVAAAGLLTKIHDARRERESIDALGTPDLIARLEDHGSPALDAVAVLMAHTFRDEPALWHYRLPLRAWKRLRRTYPKLAESLEDEFGHVGARPDDARFGESPEAYREARRAKGNGAAGAVGAEPEMAGA